MRLVTHMLVVISCAVTCTMADSIGPRRDSLRGALHAAPLARVLPDAVHEKLHPDLGLWRGSDSLRTHHTAQPARSVGDAAPEKLRGLARLRSLAQLRRLAQLRTATKPGKPASAEPAWAARIAGNAAPAEDTAPAGKRGEPAGDAAPAGRIAVNETTGEDIDYAANFAA
jgi:hypothetical protein